MENDKKTTKEKILKEENHTYSNKKEGEMAKKKGEEIWKMILFIIGVFFGIMGLSGIIFVLTQGIENLNFGNLIVLGFSALIFGASIILIRESLK